MPWPDPKAFARKHNKKLLSAPAKAKKAASVATAALKRGVQEGEAIAIGDKSVMRKTSKSATQKLKKR